MPAPNVHKSKSSPSLLFGHFPVCRLAVACFVLPDVVRHSGVYPSRILVLVRCCHRLSATMHRSAVHDQMNFSSGFVPGSRTDMRGMHAPLVLHSKAPAAYMACLSTPSCFFLPQMPPPPGPSLNDVLASLSESQKHALAQGQCPHSRV